MGGDARCNTQSDPKALCEGGGRYIIGAIATLNLLVSVRRQSAAKPAKRDQPGILGQACPSGSWWPQGWGSKPCGSEIVVASRPASEARSPLHCRPSERINRLELTVEPAELTVEPAESSQDQPCGPQPASERSSTPSANEGKFTVVVPKRVLYTDDCTCFCL